MVENRLEHSNLIVLVADTIFALKYPFISPEIQNILSDYKKIPSVLVMSKLGKTKKKDNVIGLIKSLTRPPIKVPSNLFNILSITTELPWILGVGITLEGFF